MSKLTSTWFFEVVPPELQRRAARVHSWRVPREMMCRPLAFFAMRILTCWLSP